MMRRAFLLAVPLAGALAGKALAQAHLRPDPTPRLPPQPGQGLPVEDLRFLRNASALSSAQAEVATKAVQATNDAEFRAFATTLAARHRSLTQELSAFARQHGGAEAMQREGEGAGGRVATALQRLHGLRDLPAGGGERSFLAAQLEVHPLLLEIYQAEASQTPDRELGRLAIAAMVGLQEDFSTAARLGQRYGLAVPEEMLRNPPQYGPGAGPAR